eukprot:g5973.t1
MTTLGQDIKEFLENEKDIEFEEEISRNPFRLKSWWRYLLAKEGAKPKTRNIIHERALKFLPNSYKLWHQYLGERRAAVEGKCITDPACQIVVNAHERALVHLHKMPRLWVDYLAFVVKLGLGTKARRTFDRALQALPITQHDKIWPPYLEWAKEFGVRETAVRVFRRYLMFDPAHREDYVDYLESEGQWEEAAKQLGICVNDEDFLSPHGHSKHEMWMRLCDLCAKHPEEVTGVLKVDAIIRSGLSRFTDEVGRLWCKLADYYIRLGQFERARDVYEEAINSVVTVRDFTMVFDAYTQFEESVLTAKMRMAEESGDDDSESDGLGADLDEDGDVELRLARLEHLLERRPILVSSVLLRQNPHNVNEWQKRVKLFAEDPRKAIICYTEAVKTVDPKKATGKLYKLWMDFAKFYEGHGDVANARVIFEKATLVPYKNVDDLAVVWCGWAEMELNHEEFDKALEAVQRAVAEPAAAVQRRRLQASQSRDEKRRAVAEAPVQERVFRSSRVWNLYLDLEESLGTVETAKAAYERALELKVASAQMVLNFASFLEENKYFEDAFRVYEKGVSMFTFPNVKPIWVRYLERFVERYGGSKLERARDLFEQAVEKVPAKDAGDLYIRYAKLEETHGLMRHAASVLDRACAAVEESERLDMFRLYVAKVESWYGVTQTRQVYEKAIKDLNEEGAREMCVAFAMVEQKLGEIDRARAVFSHGSQFADPRRATPYWQAWHEFEVAHGNEETFREMLRTKRSVQMSFSQVNYMAAEMMSGDLPVTSDADAMAKQKAKEDALAGGGTMLASGSTKRKADQGGSGQTDMEALERQAEKIRAAKAQGAAGAAGTVEANPEEIDLDMDMDAGEEPKTPAAASGGQPLEGGEPNPENVNLEEKQEEGGGADAGNEDIRIVQKETCLAKDW